MGPISSIDKFSFPVMTSSDDFEFRSVTSSPADHLFYNGKLLPHTFPIQTTNIFAYSRSASSKGSSMSTSRSNSTNSRSSTSTSTSTSARTSTSEASERRLPPPAYGGGITLAGRKERIVRQYGSSRRWQLIAAAPSLKHQGSRSGSRSRKITERDVDPKGCKNEECEASKSRFVKRFLKTFLSACKECHAIKT